MKRLPEALPREIVRARIAQTRDELTKEGCCHVAFTARAKDASARERELYQDLAAISGRLTAAYGDALQAYERLAAREGISP